MVNRRRFSPNRLFKLIRGCFWLWLIGWLLFSIIGAYKSASYGGPICSNNPPLLQDKETQDCSHYYKYSRYSGDYFWDGNKKDHWECYTSYDSYLTYQKQKECQSIQSDIVVILLLGTAPLVGFYLVIWVIKYLFPEDKKKVDIS